MDGEIFTIRARRCKRCGRLLTSAEAVEKGYGCQCAATGGIGALDYETMYC